MANFNRRNFIKYAGQATALATMGLSACKNETTSKEAVKAVASGKFQIFKKGEYLPFEKSTIEDRLAIAAGKKQGGMSGMPPPPPPPSGAGEGKKENSAPPPPPPPMGPPPGLNTVKAEDILKHNRLMDPYNPLFSDKKYAQAAGHPDIPAFPGFAMPMAEAMDLTIPETLGDQWYYANDGTDLHYTRHIYAGDVLESKRVAAKFEELTEDGTNLRHFAMRGQGETRDAKGNVVVSGATTLRNAYRKIIDGSTKPSFTETMTEWTLDFPKAHYTTDAEWDYIRELWKKETIRGGKVYWEDVKVGEEPAWTCSGPISHLDIIAANPIPMALNPRMMPKEAMNGWFRDSYGNYLPIYSMHYGGRTIPNMRAVFYNFTAANHVIRAVTNFIGDTGLVTRYSWYFMQLFREMRLPREVNGGEYLDKVPALKGKSLNRHGSDGDTVIGKSYITDKYVKDGNHLIDMTCWGETLDGDILQLVAVTVKLPSKMGK